MKRLARKYLLGRLFWMRHDIEVWLTKMVAAAVSHAPRWLLRAALVQCAVRATAPDLIGGAAYAGPDGVDYERMWWALDGKLPRGREDEIRAPMS